MIAVRIFETSWGRMGVAASARGLLRVVLPGKGNGPALRRLPRLGDYAVSAAAKAHAALAERQIREYLCGRRRTFTVPVDLAALPPFQRKALLAARKIPCGETVEYGRLAERVGNSRAARAVGQAMARNPVPLVIPCHRVVRAGGRLGGFGRGRALKRRLLALEGAPAPCL